MCIEVTKMFYKSINFFRNEVFNGIDSVVYREFCLLVANNYLNEYQEYREIIRKD